MIGRTVVIKLTRVKGKRFRKGGCATLQIDVLDSNGNPIQAFPGRDLYERDTLNVEIPFSFWFEGKLLG